MSLRNVIFAVALTAQKIEPAVPVRNGEISIPALVRLTVVHSGRIAKDDTILCRIAPAFAVATYRYAFNKFSPSRPRKRVGTFFALLLSVIYRRKRFARVIAT